MRNLSGLTLIELLITISIIVLVVPLGAPAISSIQKNMQLNGLRKVAILPFSKLDQLR